MSRGEPGGETSAAALRVSDLRVAFMTTRGPLLAVDRVNFELSAGQCLALVGESGSGKSTIALAVTGLIDPPGVVLAGSSVRVGGSELVGLPRRKIRHVQGSRIGIVFQDPTAALNPVYRIVKQLSEAVRAHGRVAQKRVDELVRAALLKAGIPDGEIDRVQRAFPHELSGGLQQRCAIAMAIINTPDVLVADEPTTALDATVQLGVLESLAHLREMGVAILFITHDLAVAEHVADMVGVMYAGQVVEYAKTRSILSSARHPYTKALVACAPRLDVYDQELLPIPGEVPAIRAWSAGCRFANRCPHVMERCRQEDPPIISDEDHWVRCWLFVEGAVESANDHIVSGKAP